MTIKERFEEIRTRAIKLDEEGICYLYRNAKNALSIGWTLATGEDFVKASALAHIINEWGQYSDIENDFIVYSCWEKEQEWRIIVECVWL